MIILALFIFAIQAEVAVWAEVVNSFTQCNNFFYKGVPPQGLDQNAKKICQKYGYSGYFYASLYSTVHRIPLYSAYTLNYGCTNQDARKSGDWFIEPQLSGMSSDTMQPEKARDRDSLKAAQAINGDYSNTGYDRGHLNPNSFQCGDGRKATFTLTNSAPMDACFNRVHWKQFEDGVRFLLRRLPTGSVYAVTGTVPSQDYRIPRREEFDDPSFRDFNRVTVPTHVWSAVCYEHPQQKDLSFSFGYIGFNKPDSSINFKSVPQLNSELSMLYGANVQIFTANCFSSNSKSEEIVQLLFRIIRLPLTNRMDMTDDIQNKFHTALSQSVNNVQGSRQNVRVTAMEIQESFDSLETWFENVQNMKYVSRFTCVLSQPYTGSVSSTKIQKRDILYNSQRLVCDLVPEGEPGCTSSCLYKKEARGYRCFSSSKEISCSPTYSVITVSGGRCKRGYTCGTKGKKYHWCYTDSSWDYCSPPPPMGITKSGRSCRSNHNCGWYNKGYTWCYTDYKNNWDYCCTIPDNLSALNRKTCRSTHPCGYHGRSYLWCYTTEGWATWEYCCTR